jgi:hypothetical protein
MLDNDAPLLSIHFVVRVAQLYMPCSVGKGIKSCNSSKTIAKELK